MVLLSRVKFRPCIRRILSLVLELPFVNGGHRRLRSGQGGIQRNDSVPLFQKRLVQPGVQFSVPAGEGVPEQLHAAAVGGGEEEEGGIFIFQNHRVPEENMVEAGGLEKEAHPLFHPETIPGEDPVFVHSTEKDAV